MNLKFSVQIHYPGRIGEIGSTIDEEVRKTGEAAGGRMSARMHSWYPGHLYLEQLFDKLDTAIAFATRWDHLDGDRMIWAEVGVNGWRNVQNALEAEPYV